MDPIEEQAQEIEVLQSIYPDELTLINNTHFIIRIDLDTPSERKHSLNLIVKYPPTYPEVIPQLSIELAESPEDKDNYDNGDSDEGDSDDDDDDDDDENADLKLALNMAETIEFDPKTDLNDTLMNKLLEESELNLGIPMIFNLITILKEELENLFNEKLNIKQCEFDEQQKIKELNEQKKFHGTKVTKQLWLNWRNNFRKEMKYELYDKQRFENMHKGKLTGKQIFEKGLANQNDDDDEEGEEEGENQTIQEQEKDIVDGIKRL